MKFIGYGLIVAGMLSFRGYAATEDNLAKYLLDSVPSTWEYHPSVDGHMISVDDNWWTNFGDPLLDSIVAAGLEANYDVKMAMRRVSIARNTYKSAQSDYFPAFSLSAGWEKNRFSGLTTSRSGKATHESYWDIGLSMSWQIDLFGKVTSSVNYNRNLWQASQAEWAGTMLTVAGEIVNQYIALRTAQIQLALTKRHADSQLKVVSMVEARKEAGVASMLDVAQAKTVYYSTLASVPTMENSVSTALNALAVLLAVNPSQLPAEVLVTPEHLPDFRILIATGIPMELLRRRPDIVEAEKTVAAYAAQLGIAKKDFLPTLTLDGSISTQAMNIGDTFKGGSFGYSIVPTLSWEIFDGGQRRYNLLNARQNLQSEIDSYNLTVATAVEETNNAITGYYTTLKHIDYVDEVVTQADKSLTLSVDLYKSGLSAFSNVVDSQLTLLEYENEAVTARSDALTSLVHIYIALGGGWDTSNIK